MSTPTYAVLHCNGQGGYRLNFCPTDPYEEEVVKRYDQMLHRTLSKIFRERCPTRRSSWMKELLRSSRQTAQDYIIKLILELEPALGEIFDFPDGKKLSLLWTAVLMCCQKSAELLVQSGADINERLGTIFDDQVGSFNAKTTILQALLRMKPSAWNERFITLVTEKGADLNAQDSLGRTALHVAVRKNRIKESKMLLEKGVDVNAADNNNLSPLSTASYSGACDELMLLLINHGADVTLRDAAGMNVMHYLGFSAPDVDHNAKSKQVKVLIEKGASLNDQFGSSQYQPLHVAVHKKNIGMAKLFLKYGADVNARATNGIFPLSIVAADMHIERGHHDMMSALLEHGADIDMKGSKGHTALHIACKSFNYEAIYKLLTFGANMYLKDNDGNTPILSMDPLNPEIPSVQLMLRMLALQTTCMQPSIAMKDTVDTEGRIQENSNLQNYYQNCVEEIRNANSTVFIEKCTLLDILRKCQCEIAPLMRNHEFESKFEKLDFERLPKYSNQIRETVHFIRQEYYLPLLELENTIEETWYYILPHIIVRKIAHYRFGCEKCKIRNIVRASRGSSHN